MLDILWSRVKLDTLHALVDALKEDVLQPSFAVGWAVAALFHHQGCIHLVIALIQALPTLPTREWRDDVHRILSDGFISPRHASAAR